jgi:hypothetical protein
MGRAESIPSDQFERCVEELRKAALLVEEIQRASDVATGLNKHEAQDRLAKAREHMELAGFYLDKAIKATLK